MPRPNQHRKMISLYVSETGLAELDRIAATYGVTRSEVIRMTLTAGLPAVERQLSKGTK